MEIREEIPCVDVVTSSCLKLTSITTCDYRLSLADKPLMVVSILHLPYGIPTYPSGASTLFRNYFRWTLDKIGEVTIRSIGKDSSDIRCVTICVENPNGLDAIEIHKKIIDCLDKHYFGYECLRSKPNDPYFRQS